MKGERIYELIEGIREEFILEAEPKRLTALCPGTAVIPPNPESKKPNLYAIPGGGADTRSRSRARPARRWMTAACLALAILLVGGTGLGGLAVLGGIGGGDVGMNSLFSPNFWGNLFPFLSPDETETPHQVTVRDPDETEEPETQETQPPETQPEDPCAQGHDNEELLNRAPTCYAPSRLRTVCRVCGHEEDTLGEETLPHTYKDGFCADCGLAEGALDWKHCDFYVSLLPEDESVCTGYRLASTNVELEAPLEGELILPNVYYTEEYGLHPVTAIWIGAVDFCSLVTKVVIPDTVEVIAAEAFQNCRGLTEIVWPSALVEITDRAFKNCSSLTRVEIPDTVTELGLGVFEGCTALTAVTLPAGLTTLPDGSFKGCVSLAAITLPEGIGRIGESAFEGCEVLTGVTLPTGVTALGAYAFKSCYALTDMVIPEGVTEMGRECFAACKLLAEVTLPASLSVIPREAFANCAKLQSLEIPEGVTALEEGAFRETGLQSVTLSATVSEVGLSAFYGTPLKTVTFLGNGLRRVGGHAFQNCRYLTAVTLPEGTESVGTEAFKACTSLKEVLLPNSVTAIQDAAFENCYQLELLYIPTGLSDLGDRVFDGCLALSTLDMDGEGEVYAAEGNCLIHKESRVLLYGTKSTVIPEGMVTTIREKAFASTEIETLIIPEGVETIGYSAFSGCTKLTEIRLPSTLKKIDSSAFQSCRALTEVVIPEGVTTLATSLFRDCTALRTLTLPGSLTDIPDLLVDSCTALEEIHYNANVAKWQKLTQGNLLSNNKSVVFTVYCKNGEIREDGSAVLYE